MLRDLIQENVPKYIAAKSKTDKGKVIMTIVERIRRDSPSGVGLVKQNAKTGRWSFIGVEKAKDKIGHALRKATQEGSRQSKKKMLMSKNKSSSHLSSDDATIRHLHHHHGLSAQSASPSSPPGSPSKTVSYDEGSKSSSRSSSYGGYPRPGEHPPPHPYTMYPLPPPPPAHPAAAHYYPPIPPPPSYPGYHYGAYPGYYPPPPPLPHVVPTYDHNNHAQLGVHEQQPEHQQQPAPPQHQQQFPLHENMDPHHSDPTMYTPDR